MSLWRDAGFRQLWAGASGVGDGQQYYPPGGAADGRTVLQATPWQMGLLGGMTYLPFLLFGLFAGVWVDRYPRRVLMICTDVAQALLLSSIPLGYFFGVLSINGLLVVQFCGGTLNLIASVARHSLLPGLVPREQLVEGNVKLEIGNSVATIAGPSLAGGIIALASAPVAIVVDIFSYGISAILMSRVKLQEQQPKPTDARVWETITAGIRFIFGNVYLRPIVISTTLYNASRAIVAAVAILYYAQDLGLSAATIGLLFSVEGIGGLVGALTASHWGRWLGIGRAIVGGTSLLGAATLLVALAGYVPPLTLPVLGLAHFGQGLFAPWFNINQVSLRQSITPQAFLGRMTASVRFFIFGAFPIGATIGGGLGEGLGLKATLLVGGVGAVLSSLVLLRSEVVRLHAIPTLSQL